MEIWKPIPFAPDYAASNEGRIKRLTSRTRAKAGHIMKQTKTKFGYLTVGLSVDGRPRSVRTHRAVYAAFRGSIPKGWVVDHLDGDPSDNRLDNLESVTNGKNIRRGFRRDGRTPTGNKVGVEQVIEIRRSRAVGDRVTDLAKRYNLTAAAISSICTGKTWGHVDGPITPARAMCATPHDALPDAVVLEAMRSVRAGEETKAAVSRRLGVSKPTVHNWMTGKTRGYLLDML